MSPYRSPEQPKAHIPCPLCLGERVPNTCSPSCPFHSPHVHLVCLTCGTRYAPREMPATVSPVPTKEPVIEVQVRLSRKVCLAGEDNFGAVLDAYIRDRTSPTDAILAAWPTCVAPDEKVIVVEVPYQLRSSFDAADRVLGELGHLAPGESEERSRLLARLEEIRTEFRALWPKVAK